MSQQYGILPGFIFNDETYLHMRVSLVFLSAKYFTEGRIVMADSDITKDALTRSFKELMRVYPFKKITVGMICEGCSMNRKSFYYHFKDKHELVFRIFLVEFMDCHKEGQVGSRRDLICELCMYLEANRDFYRKVFKYEGQNCFAHCLASAVEPYFVERAVVFFESDTDRRFFGEIMSQAFVGSLRRWVLSGEDISPERFVYFLESAAPGLCKN